MRRLALLPLAFLLLGAGKNKKTEPPPPPPPEESQEGGVEGGVVGGVVGGGDVTDAAVADALKNMNFTMDIKLLDAGAEPRQPLRYAPRAGAVVNYETTMSMTMDMGLVAPDGTRQALPAPGLSAPMIMAARNTVGQPGPDGHTQIRLEQLGGRYGGDPNDPMSAAMNQSLAGMAGLAINYTVDPMGKVVGVDAASATMPGMEAALDGMGEQLKRNITPFPTDAIGKGAKWVVAMDMDVNGLSLAAEQTYTVVELTKDTVTFDVTLNMHPGPGGFNFPGLPPEMKIDLQKLDASGGGRLTTDLGTLVSTGKMKIDMAMVMAMSGPGMPSGQPMVMDMKMVQDMDIHVVK